MKLQILGTIVFLSLLLAPPLLAKEVVRSKLKKYDSAKGMLFLENGQTYSVRDEVLQFEFDKIPMGTPLKLELDRGNVQHYRKIRREELDLFETPLESRIEFVVNRSSTLEGILVERDENSFSVIPLLDGYPSKGMRVRYSIGQLRKYKVTRRSSPIPRPIKVDKKKADEKEVIPETVDSKEDEVIRRHIREKPSSEPSQESESSGFVGLVERIQESAPGALSPVFKFVRRYPNITQILLVGLVLFILSTVIRLARGKQSKSQGSGKSQMISRYGGMSGEENLPTGPFVPSQMKLRLEYPGDHNGCTVELDILFSQGSREISPMWEVLMFIQFEEDPESFRLANNYMTFRNFDPQNQVGQRMMVSETTELFTQKPRPKIYPLLFTPKVAEKVRDALQGTPVVLPPGSSRRSFHAYYTSLKTALGREVDFQDIPLQYQV